MVMEHPPQPPRGKELRLVLGQSYQEDDIGYNGGNTVEHDGDSDDDDEPLAKQKTKTTTKSSAAKKSPKKKKSSPSKKTKKSPARSNSSSNKGGGGAKRKLMESDEDDDAVVAAIVVSEPPKKKSKTKSSKKKTKSSPSSSGGGGSGITKAMKKERKAATAEQIAASLLARAQLRSTISSLPHTTEDGLTIRSLGNIVTDWEDNNSNNKKDKSCKDVKTTKYEEDMMLYYQDTKSTSYTDAANLYPVGYSCDRYEFSPIHGRLIKIRCEILDGRLVSSTFVKKDDGATKNGAAKNGDMEPPFINETGPIFRIMWGEGIDADTENNPESIPFHVGEENHDGANTTTSTTTPEVGRRCCVQFDSTTVREGTIQKVSFAGGKKGWNISLLYDDGVVENTVYPDPDIRLFSSGAF